MITMALIGVLIKCARKTFKEQEIRTSVYTVIRNLPSLDPYYEVLFSIGMLLGLYAAFINIPDGIKALLKTKKVLRAIKISLDEWWKIGVWLFNSVDQRVTHFKSHTGSKVKAHVLPYHKSSSNKYYTRGRPAVKRAKNLTPYLLIASTILQSTPLYAESSLNFLNNGQVHNYQGYDISGMEFNSDDVSDDVKGTISGYPINQIDYSDLREVDQALASLRNSANDSVSSIPQEGSTDGRSADFRNTADKDLLHIRDSNKHQLHIRDSNPAYRYPKGATAVQNVNFDSDSFAIGIDSFASCTMSFDQNDFEPGTLKPMKGRSSITPFGKGDPIKVAMIGTIVWSIDDDNGRKHRIAIPRSLYVPDGNLRLLSPQHWAREVTSEDSRLEFRDRCKSTQFSIKCSIILQFIRGEALQSLSGSLQSNGGRRSAMLRG
mmetsp:Transcript_5112/g.5808  ORF Transcript_5112/g.5808 Transcript_5112/m.5808 type:complete len:433 (+) Transcript_5112:1032-2330(+)